MKKIFFLSALCMLGILSSCRNDEPTVPSTNTPVTDGNPSTPGFYVLNEGQMGSNNSTLDFFDASTGIYSADIYAERNPTVIKELGDTGNDLKVYNGRLYAVMNGSHKVEIMTADSAKHIAEVDIPNGRYICFDGETAYVSSYVGASYGEGDIKGAVYRFNTKTLSVIDSVVVGYQPEELAIANGKLYVANSGGYRYNSGYDNTVSVIDLATFQKIKDITVDINLHRVKADNKDNLYVSSRGNYMDIAANLYVIDAQSDNVIDTLNIGATDICIVGDTAYTYSSEFSYETFGYTYTYTYHTIDLNTREVAEAQFITDGTTLVATYGMAVDPKTRQIYFTDAGDYVNSGSVYCFSPAGKLQWKADAGVSPGHIAFTE